MANKQRTLDQDCIAKIVMLGATGVGKTSLLASMYPFLMPHFPGDDYKLVPREETKSLLDREISKLEKLGDGGVLVPREERSGPGGGTQRETPLVFDLQYSGSGSKPVNDIQLQILDLPGGYYTENDGLEAIKCLSEADVTFWCIDSVALMERNGTLNDNVNVPKKVIDVFAESNINSPHTFVVVLVCCEKWEQDEDVRQGSMQELFDKFENEFAKPLIKICRNRKIGKVYYTAVQTTGNLRINSFDGNTPLFMRHQGKTYAPANCELPVLCAVQQSINTVISKSRNTLKKIRSIPFVRLFLPTYWKAKARIKRLNKQLPIIEQTVNGHTEKIEKDKRLFEW